MGSLKEDIDKSADWIVKAFAEDKLRLNYTIVSFITIDEFFIRHASNGKAIPGGRLSENMGAIIFSLGAYIGNTIIRNVPGSVWETDDEAVDGEITVSVILTNGCIIWPMQRVMKRLKNGIEDSIYVYGHNVTEGITGEKFDSNYWKVIKEPKPKWKFW